MKMKMVLMKMKMVLMVVVIVSSSSSWLVVMANGSDTNEVYEPCADTKIKKSDGFTLGIAFASKTSFHYNYSSNQSLQLSPCDKRLSLSSSNSQLALFRPKVDQISILTINTSSFYPENYGGYMVAFAGRKYAARSAPVFVADGTYTITSFTLVLEFQKGRLENLFWKSAGCASCSTNSTFVCYQNHDCAIKTTSCKSRGGSVDCNLGIQLAFSGTDKHLAVLNSWYEVQNLRQYSLYNLYFNLKDSLTSQYSKFF